MSHLSPQEVTAGISRAALATIRKNGNGDTPHPVSNKSDSVASKVDTAAPAQVVRSIYDGTSEMPVIETPYRRLSILENRDGEIVLRDASFVGSKCDVALIHLEREQARALGQALLSCYHAESPNPVKQTVRRKPL